MIFLSIEEQFFIDISDLKQTWWDVFHEGISLNDVSFGKHACASSADSLVMSHLTKFKMWKLKNHIQSIGDTYSQSYTGQLETQLINLKKIVTNRRSKCCSVLLIVFT